MLKYVSSAIKSFSLVGVMLLAFSTQAVAQQELQLVFGLYATDKPSVLVKTFRPMLTAIEKDLSESLEMPVSIQTHISRTYESGVAALVNGDVDFARFGPASYVTATEQNPNLRILALDSNDNAQTFNGGVIAVHEDSQLKRMSDLVGKSFAFGNEESTIGRYLSQSHLREHGISTKELKNYEYLDRHDRVGHAVANRTFDAGALKTSTFKKLRKNGLKLRSIAILENVNKPWIASSDMDNDLYYALRNVMFRVSSTDAFEALGRKQFVYGHDSDFERIRDAIDNNQLFFHSIDSITAENGE